MEFIRKVILVVLLTAMIVPLPAQDRDASTYVFMYQPGSQRFDKNFLGNDIELERLERDLYYIRNQIFSGTVAVRIDSWSTGAGDGAANLALSEIRSSRIKSELIANQELLDKHFRTKNYAGGDNFVCVRFVVPSQDPLWTEDESEEIKRLRAELAELKAAKASESYVYQDTKSDRKERKAAKKDAKDRSVQERTKQSRPVIQSAGPADVKGWYVGLQAGVPYVESAYSSLATGNIVPGWSAGLYVGYHFIPGISLELQASQMHSNLAARTCCPDYWISSTGAVYEAAVANEYGWNWHDLKSNVTMNRLALQLNVDVLGFTSGTSASGFSLDISPRIAAYSSKPDFIEIGSGQRVLAGNAQFLFGAGGRIQLGYTIARHLNIGIFTGADFLFGKHLDGTPEHRHNENFVWETGLRLGWTFGKKEVRR